MLPEDIAGLDASEAVPHVLGELIGLESISPEDDFYAIGGHSLLIVKVIRHLRTRFGLSLDARQFAVNSQVAALIAACSPIADSVRVPSPNGAQETTPST